MVRRVGRRTFLKSAAAGAALVSAAPQARGQQAEQQQAAAPAHPPHRPTTKRPAEARLFLNDAEAAFLTAAIDVFLPADDAGPSGMEAGVLTYLDRQLAGAWGSGERMYLEGPWSEGTPQQGYQLPLTPARLFRLALAECDGSARAAHGKRFADLTPEQREAFLAGLDNGEVILATLPGRTFMRLLLAAVVEGYFADPAYGGNRDKAVWRMIGFPGARAIYMDDIERFRGKPFAAEPVSLADLQ